MKRQKVRKAIILISFLLFPIIIYYLSPYVIIQGAAEGIMVGSFIVFAGMLFTSIFFGRAYCGWICAPGGLQECLMIASNKKAKGGRLNRIKYIIWIPWMASIIILVLAAGGFKKIDFLYLTTYGISVANPMAYIIYYGVILIIVILSLTMGRRAFCHYICWMAPFMIIGTKIKYALKIPSLHLVADQSKCISCKQCTKGCPMSLEVEEMVKKGCMKNAECILCGECVDTCPKSVIKYRLKQ